MVRAKKKVLTELNQVKRKRVPNCPDHGVPMKYVMERMQWRCAVPDCRRVVWPENDEGNTRPVLGRGELELVRINDPEGRRDGRYFLRTTGNNVMVDVTDYMGSGPTITQSATEAPEVSFTLYLHAMAGL